MFATIALYMFAMITLWHYVLLQWFALSLYCSETLLQSSTSVGVSSP